MAIAVLDDFLRLEKGEEVTFHHQEFNPPDRSKIELLEIRWKHDHIDGDLIFGSMDIPGIGVLEVDAYVYRLWEIDRPDFVDSTWLSPVNVRAALENTELYNLTGGPLHTEKLLPSEIHARSDHRNELGAYKGPAVIPFSRDEQSAILSWQNGIEEKGFKSDFPRETYVQYKRASWHSLATNVENGGLQGNLEIHRLRKGLFSSIYSARASDDSYRRSPFNPMVKHARPAHTVYMQEECDSFDHLLKLMDRAIDMLVQRNERYLS